MKQVTSFVTHTHETRTKNVFQLDVLSGCSTLRTHAKTDYKQRETSWLLTTTKNVEIQEVPQE